MKEELRQAILLAQEMQIRRLELLAALARLEGVEDPQTTAQVIEDLIAKEKEATQRLGDILASKE